MIYMKKILFTLFLYLFFIVPLSAETWYFAVVGDTQGVTDAEPVSPVFDKIIKEVNELKPDFLIHLGDKVCGSTDPEVLRKQFLIHKQKTTALTMPLYEVPGNHDLPSKDCYPVYREIISPRRYYSFDHKGCHFVVLSSEENAGISGGLGKTQLTWLEEDLKDNSGQSVFIFIHRPPYPGVSHPYFLGDAEELKQVLRHNKVKYIFAGHEHRFGINRQDGITEYISGGGGAPLLYFSENAGGFYHFLMVKIENGKPEVDFVKIDHPKAYHDFESLWNAYQRLNKNAEKEEGKQ